MSNSEVLKLDCDFNEGWGNIEEAYFWIAVMENPHSPEPYCYGASIGYSREEALPYIERLKGKHGEVFQQEVLKIWNKTNTTNKASADYQAGAVTEYENRLQQILSEETDYNNISYLD